MNQAQLTPSSVYRRLSQVGLSICLLISVLNMWVNTSVNGSKVHIDTLSQLTRQMAQQSALSAANFIKQKQPQQLTLLLNNLTSNEYIEQSMIYDNNGNVLARSEEALTAHQAHLNNLRSKASDINRQDNPPQAQADNIKVQPVDNSDPQTDTAVTADIAKTNGVAASLVSIKQEPTPLLKTASAAKKTTYKTYITEIIDDHQVIGYLRLNYLMHKALKAPLSSHKGNMDTILLMMILSGVIGFMLTRGFSRFSRQSFRLTKEVQQETQQQ